MYYFCTYFDSNYLPRARCFLNSLKRHCPSFHIYILCMDDGAYRAMSNLKWEEVTPVKLSELENFDEQLRDTRSTRSLVEYYYTCSPAFPLFVLAKFPHVQLITLCDADLYMFSDPTPIFTELDDNSIAIIAHRYARKNRRYAKSGTFNVGWQSFRRDENGMACLGWWREKCLEWCYDRYEGGKFADQGYLDEFPQRFRSVRVIQHKGANVAAWNVGNYALTCRDGSVFVDDHPLIFYHFAGLKELRPRLYDTQLGAAGVRLTGHLRNDVYVPYLTELSKCSGNGAVIQSVRKAEMRFHPLVRYARAGVLRVLSLLRQSYVELPAE